MFRPTAGEVLRGVVEGLRESVLPVLGPGAAQRQLKSAVHVLGRIARSWDLLPAYLIDDNEDIRSTLRDMFARLAGSGDPLPARIAAIAPLTATDPVDGTTAPATAEAAAVPGINDPGITADAALNLRLQAALVELDAWLRAPERASVTLFAQQGEALDRLFERMVARELKAWDADPQDG